MADDNTTPAGWTHPINAAALDAALRYEFATATTREQKAAIKEQLDLLHGSNGLQDRSGVETAGTGPTDVPAAAAPASPGRHADTADQQ